ncbi:TetR/AcrR family transcriptional regulator [Phytohabitans houttuyneae]|uniref:TetR family transcriptional regulator n=1 Tax=Phytohabitans houttuyneae TaxID=1076126 RepID=A0A6V8KIT6_9ACTN|nr:TetR/AcrR family transcriptional regulator [Phytohabitans houttuyneae]GFJ82361.1 TetR family transcriptional regulator [Phytohabitans houttuyneae]
MRTTAARLIREHGYDAATMDLLADELGLNKGTLYHYYPSKSAILYELLSDQVDATLELVGRVPRDGSATDRMRSLIRLQVEHVATKQDELVVFFQELPWIEQHLDEEQATDLRRRIDRYERFTRQLITAGVRAGEFRELNVNMIMYSVIGILAYVPNWFRGTARKAQESLVDELSEFVVNGILRR